MTEAVHHYLRIRHTLVTEQLVPVDSAMYPDMTPEQAREYELELDSEETVTNLVECLSMYETVPAEDATDLKATFGTPVLSLKTEIVVEVA